MTTRPSEVIPKILANDPTLIEVNLTDNATYQMKQADYSKQLSEALLTNDQLKRLTLSKLNLTDQSVSLIAEALKTNKSITYLDVSNNKFGNVGLIAIAEALKVNKTVIELSVIGQSQAFGEVALQKMTEMFEYNVILQKINWRLHSRQSFALNKLISRNVDINRRIVAGQKLEDYINLVPGPRKGDFGVAADFIVTDGGSIPTTQAAPAKQSEEIKPVQEKQSAHPAEKQPAQHAENQQHTEHANTEHAEKQHTEQEHTGHAEKQHTEHAEKHHTEQEHTGHAEKQHTEHAEKQHTEHANTEHAEHPTEHAEKQHTEHANTEHAEKQHTEHAEVPQTVSKEDDVEQQNDN